MQKLLYYPKLSKNRGMNLVSVKKSVVRSQIFRKFRSATRFLRLTKFHFHHKLNFFAADDEHDGTTMYTVVSHSDKAASMRSALYTSFYVKKNTELKKNNF